jgi:gluconokinase
MKQAHPTIIPGLRSPYDEIGGIVYFARMLDKIRLHAQGKLPPAWVKAKGTKSQNLFDARCCRFFGIDYHALECETLRGRNDDEMLTWSITHGCRRSNDAIEIWNAFMTKRGWRDSATPRLNELLTDIGLPPGTVATLFDFIDLDEGRPPRYA